MKTKIPDEELVAAVRGGAHTLTAILSKLRGPTRMVGDRDVDRTLQRARKKGLIEYSGQRTGWIVKESK